MSLFNCTASYEVTERRALIALNVAAAIGAGLITSLIVGRVDLLAVSLFYFFAHLIWFVAINLLGGPIWFVMHQLGLRHWIHAGLAGGVALGIACMALMTGFFTGSSSFWRSATRTAGQWIWIDGKLTAEGWLDAIRTSLWVSLLGVILGLVIWRIAYRRAAV